MFLRAVTAAWLAAFAAFAPASPSLAATSPNGGARQMRILLEVRGDAVVLVETRVVPGSPQRLRDRGPVRDFVLSLETDAGERVATATAKDPTRLRSEWSPDGKRIEGAEVRLPSTQFLVSFPYDGRASRLRVARPVAAGDGGAKAVEARVDPDWKVATRDVAALDLASAPSAVSYAKEPAYAASALVDSGPSENRLDVVFLGDGYRLNELDKFHRDVQQVADYMLSVEPYRGFASMINVHYVDVVSEDSGIDDPEAHITRDTALDLSFGVGGVQRCVYTRSPYKVYAAAAAVPEYDYIFVMANDSQYGGCGGEFACFTTHEAATEIAVHEFGHSFGLLADEYGSYGNGGSAPAEEPDTANATKAATRSDLVAADKWDYWIEQGQRIPTPDGTPGVGLFEGAVYTDVGAYRPASTCRMRELGVDFCPICREQHVLRLHAYVDPIDWVSPSASDAAAGERVLATTTDARGDAADAFDVVSADVAQVGGALVFGFETAAPPPAPSNSAFSGYTVRLSGPTTPGRRVNVTADRRARLLDDDYRELASLGAPTVDGNRIEVAVPLAALGDPEILSWSIETQAGPVPGDAVAGTTLTLARAGGVVLPLAPSEGLTLRAALVGVSGAAYAEQWLVDGAPAGAGSLLSLAPGSLARGSHTIQFQIAGSTPDVRRDAANLLKSSRELTVVVGGDTSSRPTASAGEDARVGKGTVVRLDAGAAPGLSYTWHQFAGPAVELDDPHAASPSFTAPSVSSSLAFELVVGDGRAVSLPDDVVISVGDVPAITRVAAKGGAKLVVEGTQFVDGAVIEVNAVAVTDTKSVRKRGAVRLSSKQAFAAAPAGRAASVTVVNPDGTRSAPYAFTR